jgi:hydroxymethylpyrimidine pyrophosphatase-like HAD family hydrolase
MSPHAMLPLRDLTADALADAPGLACDFDDTVTTHGVLTAPALAALHALAGAGVPCLIATGRPLGWAEVLARSLPVRAVVTENGGAWIAREGSRVRVAFAVDASERRDGMARVEAAVAEVIRAFPRLARVRELTVRATDVALDIGEEVQLPAEYVSAALEFVRARGLFATASTVHLHVSAWAPDKARGLCAAAADVGLDAQELPARWVFVGDSPNDAGAFAAFARAVGVANVRAFEGRMSAWPRYVAEESHGAGFAEVVARLLAARSAAR